MEGTPFGRYQLLGLLGRGGMGEVWRAHDTATDRTVAIKTLPAQYSDDPTFQQRFRREAQAAARLNSPHVIPIHDYGEIDGRLYVTMRLVEGRDLHAVIADGPMQPTRAVRIIEQVAKALHAAHKVGLVHRDVKPSNVLLDEDDFAYLIDFGIARATDDTRMTGTGNAIGTFQYMAPERLGGSLDDARADIYALACVFYECLTGQPPFAGSNMASLVAAHLNTPPPQPSATDPGIPPRLDRVIATGMAKDPDLRYATTVELSMAAHDAMTAPIGQPASPPDTEPSPPTPATIEYTDPVTPLHRPTASRREQPSPQSPATARPKAAIPPSHVALPSAPTQQRARAYMPPQKPPGQPPTPSSNDAPGTSRAWWKRPLLLIPAVLTVVLLAAVVAFTQYRRQTPTAAPSPTSPSYGSQIVLPFTYLGGSTGVAVDGVGNVYVADTSNDRALKLAAGSTNAVVLPFAGLLSPTGLAVDGAAANVYFADGTNNRVYKYQLASETPGPVVLPFIGLQLPTGVAVDGAGDLYVTDRFNNRVLKLAAGATSPDVLPFTDLGSPTGVAVDTMRNVYIVETGNNRVLKLAAGSSSPEVLLFTGLRSPEGVAVDGAGNVYIADTGNARVLRLATGSTDPLVLPFIGLSSPTNVAVDNAGNVFVADFVANFGANQILKLPTK